jgi:hypothetical protein
MRGLVLALCLAGCATTRYEPRVVARGELTLRYRGGFELWAGEQRVARSLTWKGLDAYVRCVEPARVHAAEAARAGRASIALSAVGGALGVASLGGLYGLADDANVGAWLGGGIGVAAVGLAFVIAGRVYHNRANGHAVDAHNYYNDAVGALGASCDDLRYPPAVAPQPPTADGAPLPPPRPAAPLTRN